MPVSFEDAATRMFKDGETLFQRNRLGAADHLFGLAAECALKAILTLSGVITGSPPAARYKCHVNALWHEYQTAVGGVSRLIPPVGTNPFADWEAAHRYEEDHMFDRPRVDGHRRGAMEAMKALADARVALGGIR
ncbi:MAG: hypothetical protein MJD61_02640 [Proteobacteria bacterium]|nr:hypothetical protein [Pseudomonadota bacterium]